MKKTLYVNLAGLLLASLPVQACEKQPSQPEQQSVIDGLPDVVILNEIMPKLDNKSLSHWARSSKKYAELFKNELGMREATSQYFSEISNEYLEALHVSPEKAVVELKTFALSPEQLKQYAKIERNMRKQRAEFIQLIENGTELWRGRGSHVLTKLYSRVFDDPKFKNLKQLDLSDNHLTELPSNIFKRLENLTCLYLCFNLSTELPIDIFKNLKNLHRLHISHNNLTELPANIFNNLNKLEELWLDWNNLNQLPARLFNNLINLKELKLGNNNLAELPTDIFKNLKNLQALYLDDNNLTELPADIFKNLKNLQVLMLGRSALSEQNKNEIKKVLPSTCIIEF